VSVAVALALAGCGVVTTGTMTTQGVISPGAILRSALAALPSVHSDRVQFSGRDAKGPFAFTFATSGRANVEMSETRSHGTFAAITTGSASYFKASLAFWDSLPKHPAAVVDRLAGHWTRFPAAESAKLARYLIKLTDPATRARCWAARVASLQYVGHVTVDGVPTIELRNPGTAPGTSPGLMYVATTNPMVPIKTVVNGPQRPGGPAVCGHGTLLSGVGIVTDINQPVLIRAPAHPMSFPASG
jgi:hypothetical protein